VKRRVASLSQLKDGLPDPIYVEDEEIVLIRTGDKVYALFDRCSHQDFPLSLGKVDSAQCRIKCAAHGAEFDLASGKAMTAPAFAPVQTYPVEINGDDVYIEIDL
jgi:3-phenylpropionate/trans-cinnamate dioxygenase ferredoxin subunit